MKEFENYLKLHVNSSKTIEEYVRRVKNFFKKFNEFNQENVNLFLQLLVEAKKSSAFNLSLASFTHYIRFLKIDIELPKTRKISNKIKDTLSRDEIEDEIFPYFADMFEDNTKRMLIVRFMMLTMMRISEIVNLKKDEIDFESRVIKINEGKGDKNRITFLPKSLVDDVKQHVQSHDSEYALNVTKSYIKHIFHKINTELNYKKHVTPHTLRHSGATQFYNETKDLEKLQDILGHESLDTTKKYIHHTIEEMKQCFDMVKYKKRK